MHELNDSVMFLCHKEEITYIYMGFVIYENEHKIILKLRFFIYVRNELSFIVLVSLSVIINVLQANIVDLLGNLTGFTYLYLDTSVAFM